MALALLITTIGAIIVTAVAILGLLGKLPPNTWAGIRTPFTRRSDENWYRTHRAAAPLMIFTGVAATMTGLAFLPFALAGEIGDGLAAAVALVQAGLILIGALGGWLVGTGSAKRQAANSR